MEHPSSNPVVSLGIGCRGQSSRDAWELAVRSVVSAAAFLLLDCLRASAAERGPLLLAAVSIGPDLFQRIIHTSWLGPGLVLAVILALFVLMSGSSRKPMENHGLVRRFRTPRLERYRGVPLRQHQDLDV